MSLPAMSLGDWFCVSRNVGHVSLEKTCVTITLILHLSPDDCNC